MHPTDAAAQLIDEKQGAVDALEAALAALEDEPEDDDAHWGEPGATLQLAQVACDGFEARPASIPQPVRACSSPTLPRVRVSAFLRHLR